MKDADPPGRWDLEAVARLFQEHLSPLTRFVDSYVKSWEVAEDIVHDAFLQLWLRHRNCESIRDLTAYVYTIARYDALDYLRHQRIEARHRGSSQHDTVATAEADCEALASEVAASLQRAIDLLPPRQREVMLMRWENQASYDEIAAKLCISRKTVDIHVQRAFAKLRKLLPHLVG